MLRGTDKYFSRGRMFGDRMSVHSFCHRVRLLLLFRRIIGLHILRGAIFTRFVSHRLMSLKKRHACRVSATDHTRDTRHRRDNRILFKLQIVPTTMRAHTIESLIELYFFLLIHIFLLTLYV